VPPRLPPCNNAINLCAPTRWRTAPEWPAVSGRQRRWVATTQHAPRTTSSALHARTRHEIACRRSGATNLHGFPSFVTEPTAFSRHPARTVSCKKSRPVADSEIFRTANPYAALSRASARWQSRFLASLLS
jgi:hypothetical protein